MAITSEELPSADDFARLEGELFTRIERSHNRQVRRRRFVAAGAAVLLVAGGSAAAGTIANPQVQSNVTYCYRGADVASGYAEDVNADEDANPTTSPRFGPKRIANAVGNCAAIWQEGIFGTKIEHPDLQACIQDNLIVAVFLRDNTESAADYCEDQGMTAP